MPIAKQISRTALATAAALTTTLLGCGEPRCPRGFIKKGDTCHRIKDAGAADASDTEIDGSTADVDDATSSDQDSGLNDAGDGMTNGGATLCEPNPCEHGGRCSEAGEDFSCDCAGTGYEGATCKSEIDECASLNACTSSVYPCVETAPPGYACRGQFADWPMPDALAGAKFAPAYDTSTPGVVVDEVTGLFWQSKLGERVGGYSWIEATLYCEELDLAGHSDWRLPTKIELESIVDETLRPAIDSAVFGSPDAIVWSASPAVGEPGFLWLIDFLIGSALQLSRDETMRFGVRCVRGPAEALSRQISPSRYVIDGASDTIRDDRTRLVWQRTLSTGNHTWEGAKSYCASLGAGWRLPAFKELLTLVDPARIKPSIDPQFPETPSVSFWTASPWLGTDGGQGSPRLIDFYDGSPSGSDATAHHVRCVK